MCAYNDKNVSTNTINNYNSSNKNNNNGHNRNNRSNKRRSKNLNSLSADHKRRQRKHCRKQDRDRYRNKRTTSKKSYTNSSSRISLKTAQRKTRRSYTACCIAKGLKWKIILSTIILLLWRTSHVQAIRKGRLMTPTTFTALSGDLHVQIQFSSETIQQTPHAGGIENVALNGQTTATSSRATPPFQSSSPFAPPTPSRSPSTPKFTSTSTSTPLFTATTNSSTTATIEGVREVENIMTSTLVISKYIDEALLEEDLTTTAATVGTEPTLSTADSDDNGGSGVGGGSEDRIVLHRRRKEIVQNIPVYPDPRHNVTQVAVPCQTFMRGGLYEMQVVTNLKTTTAIVSHRNATSVTAPTVVQTTMTLIPVTDERLRQTLDVRWPSAEMLIKPDRLLTYPDSPVEVELRFPDVNCERAWQSGEDLPEFWLELIYCGKERSCAQLPPLNVSKSNILYAEQVHGYPKNKLLTLGCELFGLAGNYAVQLRPMVSAPGVPITRRFLSVDWSDKFVFNVYARSIFPCDTHTGIGVLYEYPACILEQGDRVRLYAKLRADVASLKPPTSLHYVAEQRVVKSQYSLYFSCDLFTEKYVEYCFVYVSQAISGAVADVRMDCVPTLPVSESDTGGWGPWSDWTPCSTNCLGGTRNRYRFCDSPPPRYGAKFCEGPFVETEKCGQQNMADTWDCLYETSYGNSIAFNNLQKANRTEVSQEIGPGCRCGCIVHLGASKPKRYIAGATQSCPGRSFWLIQVDGIEVISLSLDFLRLPCVSQYIKVRDGPSLSSTLLVELNGARSDSAMNRDAKRPTSTRMESTGAQLLVEFYAGGEDEPDSHEGNLSKASTTIDPTCTGGFLANVEQLVRNHSGTPSTVLASSTSTRLSPNSVKSRTLTAKVQRFRNGFTFVHLSAVVFASIIIIISAMLGAQYIVRYRKYHLAITRRRDEGSRLHTPRASINSLQSPPSRAMSTTTLLSEVICLVKLRPKHQLRHSILRESVDAENLALARETSFADDHSGIGHVTLNKCAEDMGSTSSIVTLRNELTPPSPSHQTSVSRTPSATGLTTPDVSVNLTQSPCGTLTRKDSSKDTESIISSGMSSVCNSPPMNLNRLSKYSDRYDAVTLKIRNSHASMTQNELSDASSMRSSLQQLSASLTNGCYSPAVSIVSTATIRTTNPKESKEKQNRKKLLARPGSEFSLGNQEELEMDYYDYNVINAGAAPGSYLGMDPAYLIWIPPFEECTTTNLDDGDKTPEPNESLRLTDEPDENIPLYEEIRKMPKYGHYLSPGSNSESTTTNTNNTSTPTSDEISPLSSNMQSKVTTPSDNYLKNSLIQQVISVTAVGGGAMSKPPTPYMTRKQKRAAKQQSKSAHALGRQEQIALNDFSGTKSARNIAPAAVSATTTHSSLNAQSMSGSYVEKETEVVKSPSGDLQNFLALDDIKFADENEGSDFYEAVSENEAASKHQHQRRSAQENRSREVEV